MGELIKKYGVLNIKGRLFDIELNAPLDADNGGIVHIQSDDIRMEMSQLDFYRLVGCVNLAKTNLLHIKGVSDEQSGRD